MRCFRILFRRIILYTFFLLLICLVYLSCSEKTTEPDNDDGNNHTVEADTVSDIDGNVYKTVTIGDQVWMMENLKVTHFCNGDLIPIITHTNEWADLSGPACCGYVNSDSLIKIFGLLYNWYAVSDTRNISPEEWHVPTDEEWKELEIYLGMNQSQADTTGERGTNEGDKLRETGTVHWKMYNFNATNSSGFTALPGGYRFFYGIFNNLGYLASWWTATEYNSDNAWSRFVSNSYSKVFRSNYPKNYGFSVRCIKD